MTTLVCHDCEERVQEVEPLDRLGTYRVRDAVIVMQSSYAPWGLRYQTLLAILIHRMQEVQERKPCERKRRALIHLCGALQELNEGAKP